MKKKSFFPQHILFLTSVFATGIVLCFIFRLILLFSNWNLITLQSKKFIFYAIFNRGILFDININAYFLIFPFLILTILYFFNNFSRKILNFVNFIILIFYIFLILVASSDIPYFKYFNSRITRAILNWTDNLTLMFKELLGYKNFYPFIFLFFILSFGIIFWVKYLSKRLIINNIKKDSLTKKISFSLIFLILLILGIRGEWNFKHRPITAEDSFFSDDNFVNQLGINAVFSFFDSFRALRFDKFENEVALKNVKKYLKITKTESYSPLARKINFSDSSKKPNVVIILMESMSSVKMNRTLTPFLDSLSQVSLYFPNVFSAGIHTYNGIFSTLFSFPALMHEKIIASPLGAGKIFAGISNVLSKNNYQTIFFCTGDKTFDNMNGFLIPNGFQNFVSEENFPAEKIENGWGVSDNTMFNFSISKLDSLFEQRKPFLSVFVTVTSHEGNDLPREKNFIPHSKNKVDQLYEYSDWAISQFFKQISQKKWFSNTIFALIGDHGQNFSPIYDMDLSYHQCPLIIFSPSKEYFQPQNIEKLGLQIDVFPTLMGIVKIPYVNNTLGINLLTEKRDFAYFSADNKLGCLNEKYFLIIRNNGEESLYEWKEKSTKNYISQQKMLVDSMKTYIFSMLQATQWILENNKTEILN